jgi:hypothetical protein
MDATSSRSCPETGFGNTGVENSNSTTVMLQLRGNVGERVTSRTTHQLQNDTQHHLKFLHKTAIR